MVSTDATKDQISILYLSPKTGGGLIARRCNQIEYTKLEDGEIVIQVDRDVIRTRGIIVVWRTP